MRIIFFIVIFLIPMNIFSVEYVEIKDRKDKIYTASVDSIPKVVLQEIAKFGKEHNLSEMIELDSKAFEFIMKHSFLDKKLNGDVELYTTSLKVLDIFTLFDTKTGKAYVLNCNSNNEKLSCFVRESLGGGLSYMIKSGELESFYMLVFELTYGVRAETGIFFETWVQDVDESSGEGRIVRLLSVKKDELKKIYFPSEFKLFGNMRKWECRFCAALKNGEMLECVVKGDFYDGDKLNILSVDRRVILKKGKFELLYVP